MSKRFTRSRILLIGGIAATAALVVWLVAGNVGRKGDGLAEARQAVEQRDFARRLTHLDGYLKRYPDDPEALLLAARTARRSHAYRQSSSFRREYEDAGGGSEVAAFERRLERVQAGDLAEADALLKHCDDHPDSPDVFFVLEAVVDGSATAIDEQDRRGILDESGPDVTRARRAADRLLTLPIATADHVQSLYWSGTIHARAKAQARAVADLRAAIELDPAHRDARQFLSLTIAQERPLESLDHLKVLARDRPVDPAILYPMATIHRAAGQLDESRKILDDLLATQPASAQLLLERGLVDLDAGQAERAEQYFRRALMMAPKEPDVILALSRSLRLRGESAEADRLFKEFTDLEAERKRAADLMTTKKKLPR